MGDSPEWLEGSTFNEYGYCVTFARGMSAVELLRRLGCDVATTAMKTRIDANHWIEDLADEEGHEAVIADKEWVIRAGEAGGWAFAVEDGGIRGTDRDVLAAVSTNTVALSTMVNVNAVTVLSYAVAGVLVCQYESPVNRWGSDPDRMVPELTRAGILLPDGAAADLGVGEEQRRTLRMLHAEFGLTLPRDQVEHGELLAAML
ncbi:DUF6461 domain-containing protein [Yinghuangia sp. YIM S09857]|uniref:DUF6461 domain-containing protein n=1 Tax=Yinghuangia sp. YIM S09857 TaxID=3436929 RepID=UPI003F52D2F0